MNKIKFLNSNKIVELIHAISVLVTEDNEKIHVEKKSNFSDAIFLGELKCFYKSSNYPIKEIYSKQL